MNELALTIVGGPSDPIGDVLFIHGLGGSGDSTWTSEGEIKDGETRQDFVSFFPAVLAADFPDLRFLTLDYSAEATKWSENLKWNELHRVCAGILEFLIGKGIGTRPLIMVCHSLGGIVTKEILKSSKESLNRRQRSLFDSVVGVSFLGTPHKGSKWADILKGLDSVLPFLRLTERIDELMYDTVYLEQLSKWYRESITPDVIETQAFYEQRMTKGLIIVDHVSANPDVSGCDPIPVSQNHMNICKPASKNATVYVAISGLIRFHLLEDNKFKRKGSKAKTILPPQTVVIGLVVHQGCVLMVRRRHMIDRLTWQFVSGRLRVNQEEPAECIVRELKEETGITVRADKLLGSIIDEHAPYERIYFACDYLSGTPVNADPLENSDVEWVKISEVGRYVTTPISAIVKAYLGI